MARKPIPGSDDGQWGEILNEFLDVSHASDGKLKDNTVTSSQLAPGSVNNPAIATNSVTNVKIADGTISRAKLDTAVQDTLAKADTASQPSHAHDDRYIRTVNGSGPDGAGNVTVTGSDGTDGREIELQTSATHIQWRYLGESNWTNLIAVADLKGEQGTDGKYVELQKTATHIQWRQEGGAWADLVALADLKGDPGMSSWNDIPDKPSVIAAGATQAEARAAIGAVDLSALSTVRASSPGVAFEHLRALKSFGVGTVRIAIVGDSTGNEVNEWVRLWFLKYGATLPDNIYRSYRDWRDGSWSSEIVDAPGASGLLDTFSRTGPVVGSTPDIGSSWLGTGTGWNANGSRAIMTPGQSGTLLSTLGPGDATATVDTVVTTTARSVAQSIRVYLSCAGVNGVWFSPSLNTGGGVTGNIYKTVNGTTTAIGGASKAIAGLPVNSETPVPVKVTIALSGMTVTASTVANGQTTTWTGIVDQGDLANFGTDIQISAHGIPVSDPFGFELDQVSAGLAKPADRIEIWNGSIAGATPATFDATLRAAQFGTEPFEIIMLNFGHNGGQLPGQFVATMSDWLAAWLAEHPGSAPVFMSQNPQKLPSAGVQSHAARLAALRIWASESKHPYVPVWEAFKARQDWESFIRPDGVHPTSPPIGELSGDFGSVLWADTIINKVSA